MAQWMVRSDGSDPIGPVTTELLLRGIAQGRVPVESEVQELGSREWQILEFVDVFADAIQSDDAMTKLAESPLDDDDILAYADAEEAFTRLAVPGGAPATAPRGAPKPTAPHGRPPPPPPPNSARHLAPPPPPSSATYQEDDDAATRVASSPFHSDVSQPPSIPEAARSSPGPTAGAWPAAPAPQTASAPHEPPTPQQPPQPGVAASNAYPPPQAAGPNLQQPLYQPPPGLTQQAPAPHPPATSGGSSTAILALVVLVLAGCLGVLLWLLASR